MVDRLEHGKATNKLNNNLRAQALLAMVEGNSIRAAARA